jgi:ABC-2 type transport system permease protein
MGSITNILLMLLVCTISTLFWSVVAILVSFSFKSYKSRDVFIDIAMLPITLASPAFYPLKNVPGYLQFVSMLNPLTYNIRALRDAFLYGELSYDFFFTFLLSFILFVWTAILLSKREALSSAT